MIVVTGGSGQLGTAFRELLTDSVFPSRSDLDLTEPHLLEPGLERLNPSAVINCAAYTRVDDAESEPDLARVVNADAVRALAEWTAAAAIPFVTFSTDYVFDGEASEPYTESSETHPLTVYGMTKREGERLALDANPQSLVIRTAWLLSSTHPNFVSKIVGRARHGPDRVVTGLTGSPTMVGDLAERAWSLVRSGISGIIHVVNAEPATWFDLARAAVAAAGLDPGLVEPTTSDSFPMAARRPRYSVLGTERAAETDMAPPSPWWGRVADLVAAWEN